MLCLLLFLGGLGCGCVLGIPGIKLGFCFRCAVFGAVPGWIVVWFCSRNPRKSYNQGPDSYVLCFVLFLGGLGRGCVPGILGRDIIRVLFQMCCVWCCSWCSWVGGVWLPTWVSKVEISSECSTPQTLRSGLDINFCCCYC